MGLVRTVAPTTEPIAVDDVKLFLGIDTGDADSDEIVKALIKAARDRCERLAGISLMPQTWKWTAPNWTYFDQLREEPYSPVNESWFGSGWGTQPYVMRLPYPPLVSVTSITYVDTGGNTVVLDPTLYQVDLTAQPGTITPVWGKYWPPARWQPAAITVIYTAGYADAASVPAEIKETLKVCCKHCFDYRGDRDEAFLDRLFAGFDCGSYV